MNEHRSFTGPSQVGRGVFTASPWLAGGFIPWRRWIAPFSAAGGLKPLAATFRHQPQNKSIFSCLLKPAPDAANDAHHEHALAAELPAARKPGVVHPAATHARQTKAETPCGPACPSPASTCPSTPFPDPSPARLPGTWSPHEKPSPNPGPHRRRLRECSCSSLHHTRPGTRADVSNPSPDRNVRCEWADSLDGTAQPQKSQRIRPTLLSLGDIAGFQHAVVGKRLEHEFHELHDRLLQFVTANLLLRNP